MMRFVTGLGSFLAILSLASSGWTQEVLTNYGVRAGLPPSFVVGQDVTHGDFDGDGRIDVFVSSGPSSLGRNGGGRGLYLGDGDFGFMSVELPAEFTGDAPCFVIDADRDGDDDLVAFVNRPGSMAVQGQLLLDDAGSWRVGAALPTLPTGLSGGVLGGAVADLDRDGTDDLVLAVSLIGAPVAVVWLGNGDGTFTERSGVFPTGTSRDLAVADVDRDGLVDVVIVGGVGRPRLFVNQGSGTTFVEETSTRLPAGLTSMQGLMTIDADGDGDDDLVFLSLQSTGHTLVLNDGTGTFTRSAAALPEASLATDAVTVDANVDGALDVFVTRGGVNAVVVARSVDSLWLGDGAGGFRDASPAEFASAVRASLAADVADVDGDGRSEVFVVGAGSDEILTAVGPPIGLRRVSGPRWELDPARTAIDRVRVVALADVDRDGDLDALVDGRELQLNDGSGSFTRAPASVWPGTEPAETVVFADLTGDGAPEAITTPLDLDLRDWTYRVNDGSGGFVPAAAGVVPAIGVRVQSLATGDLDGDGDEDVVLGVDGEDRWLRNDGTGRFTPGPTLPGVASVDTRAVAVVDIDRDGDLDVFTAAYLGQARLWSNDGAGAFRDVTFEALPLIAHAAVDVAVGDLDGDGAPEIVQAVERGPDVYWRNDGAGRFTADPAAFPTDSQSTWNVELVDLDADGALDVAYLKSDLGVLGNDGSGGFVDRSSDWLPAGLRDGSRGFGEQLLAGGDFDGDGDDDLIAYGEPWTNPALHLLSAESAHAGGVLALRLERRPGTELAVAFPAVSAPGPAVSLGPLGTWRLDPALAVFPNPAVLLPGVSRARLEIAIPANPALVGVELATQVAIVRGDVVRLTGRVVEYVL